VIEAPETEAEGAPVRRVVVLGSTGSIGRQALEIAAVVPGLRIVGLAAGSDAAGVVEQAAAAGAQLVAVYDEAAAGRARELTAGHDVEVLAGEAGIAELIARCAAAGEADGVPVTVLNGIVGAAGLRATMTTLASGATLALANKESLVAGGDLVLEAARRSGAAVLPVDSEHSAVFQCLLAGRPPRRGEEAAHSSPGGHAGAPGLGGHLLAAEQVVLTGSGGPFRGRTREQLGDVTPDQALRHPTWTMGRKITIDSATLMNKGLEVIEAHYLFGVPYRDIDVLISPESLVHAMVRFADGATIAHLGVPDMRTPIAYALTYPDRAPVPAVQTLDLAARQLTFEPPDTATFRCLRLAYEAGEAGGGAPVVLNAANEVAVHAFLEGKLGFLGIERVVEEALEALGGGQPGDIDDVVALDAETRRMAAGLV